MSAVERRLPASPGSGAQQRTNASEGEGDTLALESETHQPMNNGGEGPGLAPFAAAAVHSASIPRRQRPKILLIGPTPPPHHGGAIITRNLLASPLADRFDLVHLDTSDRRGLANLGTMDLRNAWLALVHGVRFLRRLLRDRPAAVHVPVAQNRLGLLRDALFLLPARALDVPTVVHLNGGYCRFFAEADLPTRALARFALGAARRVLVLGERLRPQLQGVVPLDRVAVVPYGVPDPFDAVQHSDRRPREGAATEAVTQVAARGRGTMPGPRPAPPGSVPVEAEQGSGPTARSAPVPDPVPLDPEPVRPSSGGAGPGSSDSAGDPGAGEAPPGIGIEGAMEEARAGDGNGRRPFRALYLGTLNHTKGFVDVLAAAERVAAVRPDVEFVFAGAFATPADARMAIPYRYRLGGRIWFTGVVDGKEKAHLLREADVLVFPSYYRYEGQPLVILEAMAAGLPVISTAHGVIAETVVHGETGWLVPPHDPKALAKRILQLAGDPPLGERMGRAGRERYLERYTLEGWAERIGLVWSDVLGAARAGGAEAASAAGAGADGRGRGSAAAQPPSPEAGKATVVGTGTGTG